MLLSVLRSRLLGLCAAFVFVTAAAGQGLPPKPATSSLDVQKFLSWFPADTETVIVARNFSLPDLAAIEKKSETYTQESMFANLALGPWGINAQLADFFKKQKVLVAVEGARKFRAPKGFGLMLFEGCTFIVFSDDLTVRLEQYFKLTANTAVRVENIEGHRILAFQDRSEAHTWTTFVGSIGPNTLLIATNIDYLREVLSRIRGKAGPRALPETLPEWGYVDTKAQFWGLRHFDRSQGSEDVSSPFWDPSKIVQAPWADEQAIGLTFSYDPTTRERPTITYLSGNPSAGRETLSLRHEGRKFDVSVRDLDARAITASYSLDHPEGIMFTFYLGHFLGLGIVV